MAINGDCNTTNIIIGLPSIDFNKVGARLYGNQTTTGVELAPEGSWEREMQEIDIQIEQEAMDKFPPDIMHGGIVEGVDRNLGKRQKYIEQRRDFYRNSNIEYDSYRARLDERRRKRKIDVRCVIT